MAGEHDAWAGILTGIGIAMICDSWIEAQVGAVRLNLGSRLRGGLRLKIHTVTRDCVGT